jgi:hypothetical protein
MAGFRKFGRLESAFSKQPQAMGHMPAPGMELHDKTMKPMGPKAVQTPAQHMAVEKAAKASAMKRSKKGLI